MTLKWLIATAVASCLVVATPSTANGQSGFVAPGKDGRLVYEADARGNRIPDFSHCGYGGGGVAVPDVPVRARVPAVPRDAGSRIQAAIDYVSKLPADERGLRGAVLVEAGRHEIAGCLRITVSGVVLRGQGQGPNGTLLVATGQDRRGRGPGAGRDHPREHAPPPPPPAPRRRPRG